MAGTDHRRDCIKDGPIVILVNPQMGENIGGAARAMANFGLSKLRLVDPRDGWPNETALANAAKADHIIHNVEVFETLEDALHDVQFAFATTARHREMLKPVRDPVEANKSLHERARGGEKVAVLFGRERWGLTNEEVALCDEIVPFPVNPAYASLNISQAVLLMSYEWMQACIEEGERPEKAFETTESEKATKQELFLLFEHLETALENEGYFRPEAKKPTMVENLRNIFQKAQLSRQEIHALRGAIAALEGRKGRPRTKK